MTSEQEVRQTRHQKIVVKDGALGNQRQKPMGRCHWFGPRPKQPWLWKGESFCRNLLVAVSFELASYRIAEIEKEIDKEFPYLLSASSLNQGPWPGVHQGKKFLLQVAGRLESTGSRLSDITVKVNEEADKSFPYPLITPFLDHSLRIADIR